MILAQKGNKQRQIAEAEIQSYVERGYKIVDGKGTVIQETVPTDLPTLMNSYRKHVAEIKQLRAKVKELTEQVNTLSTLREEPKKEVNADADATAEPVEKKSRGRKAQ